MIKGGCIILFGVGVSQPSQNVTYRNMESTILTVKSDINKNSI